MLGFTGIMVGIIISKETDELIKSEDERAKQIIAEGNERIKRILERMDQSTLEIREFVISLIVSDGEKTRELIKEKILK